MKKINLSITLVAIIVAGCAFFSHTAIAVFCNVSSDDLVGAAYGKTSGVVKTLKFLDKTTFSAELTTGEDTVKGLWSIQDTKITLVAEYFPNQWNELQSILRR